MESCVIGGCVKNCEKYLNNVFENIEKIQHLFQKTKIIMFYDKSDDFSLRKLCKLKQTFDLEIIINKNPLTPHRTKNIENARNKILDRIYSSYSNYTYFIMIDMDDVCAKPIYINVLEEALDKKEEWDCLSFNNENYYDFWALSFHKFQYSCWHSTNPKKIINKMNDEFKIKLKNSETDFIECQSAFGGFGIYKIEKFENIRYRSLADISLFNVDDLLYIQNKYNIKYATNNLIYDCEHRYFHLNAIKKNNCRICVYKKYLFPRYTGDHTNILNK
mgnify:CR=1 FL=1